MKLQPAMVFGSHMVLQRHQPIPIWGKAAAGDRITVTLGNTSVQTLVSGDRWSVELPAQEAAVGLEMTISAEKTAERICFTDVAVGEVWLAGGQSNMEFLMKYDIEAPEQIAAANDPLLRFFDYPEASSAIQLQTGRFEEYGFWRCWDAEGAPWFSAVGYWFAAQLRKTLNVPVGILGCNWGGTVAATWTSRETLEATPELRPVLDEYDEMKTQFNWEDYFHQHLQQSVADPTMQRLFTDVMLMGGTAEDLMAKMQEVMGGHMDEGSFAPPPEMLGPVSPNAPGVLYRSMVTQIAPYAVRGILWYQGESDEGRASYYDHSMKALRRDWCQLWHQELPLLQVMLAPFHHWLAITATDYPAVRARQKLLADTEPGFYVANIMDHGAEDNIHPRDKRWAGERLSRLARKYIYGEDILADSPSMESVEWSTGQAVVRFRHARGLHLVGEDIDTLELLSGGQPIPFNSALEGETMVIRSDAIQPGATLELRYAWQNYCIVNCYNDADLPVFPFRVTQSLS